MDGSGIDLHQFGSKVAPFLGRCIVVGAWFFTLAEPSKPRF
jgi:hypothetical protein